MAYLGGKATGSQHIIKILNNKIFNGMPYIEPFVGYAHILRRITGKSSYVASDSNQLLMVLLKHIQKSKEHLSVSADEYKQLRLHPDIDPLKAAYAAFTYSYNGKYFAGYTGNSRFLANKARNYPAERKRYYNKLHDNETFSSCTLKTRSYNMYTPENTRNSLIYCDPPYAGTAEYKNSFNFDGGFAAEDFWNWVRSMSTSPANNFVFVSEYSAPEDFVCVAQQTKHQSIAGRGATRKREEIVFIHKSLVHTPEIAAVRQDLSLNKSYSCNKTRKNSNKN
jgi:DNA adenine methylase